MSVRMIRVLTCDRCPDSEFIAWRTPEDSRDLRQIAKEAGWTREFAPTTLADFRAHRLDVCPQCAPAPTSGAADTTGGE